MRLTLLSALLVLVVSHSASAYDSHFGIDPALKDKLGFLAKSHRTNLTSGRTGNLFTVDASAVLKVDAAKMLAAALDYDHYVAFGMPHLNESHVVERASPDLLYTFASMSYLTMHSQHYLEVRTQRAMSSNGAAGIEWELVQRHPSWQYNDSPAFSRMDGSFYLEPLTDGNVYVRYYLANEVKSSLAGLFPGIVKNALTNGAADVIMVLARQAPVQP
jgi:ribosome-associated toxin RatA of RatAB toxin-antitoxin module